MKSTKQKNKAPINFLIAFLTLCMLALIVFSVYSIFFRKGNSKSKEQISDSISNSSLQEETIQTVPRPDNPNENEAYYWDNAEVLEVINANDSKSVLTESQAIELLKDRGFEDCNVIYNYSMDGQYSDESDADENADTKHPMYKAYYSHLSLPVSSAAGPQVTRIYGRIARQSGKRQRARHFQHRRKRQASAHLLPF